MGGFSRGLIFGVAAGIAIGFIITGAALYILMRPWGPF